MSHHPSFKRRTVFAVAGLTASALAFSACGREAGGAGADAGATAKPISEGKATGELTVWAIGAEGEKLPALTKEFEAANPGATVKVTAIPWDAAHDKFASAITAGQTPDAAMVGSTWMGEFAGMDALDPTPASIDKAAFFERSRSCG
ncbi:sugar ABC transporter, sugar-binding protein, putative [Janibacter sp. HTCC2649]|uniref:extracellular solute-binding protein n=1 Tax=Janibacter sp. HTCC2649 TaxID=313589 RepID=UPI0000670865|nr:extracellular solute-binding protein [Janibacter sp. HTCC2649]EAQ00267.1 sugar ABC transporter, sugar-binding protein, putative [Janibacter sp. HTCC2649]